MLKVDAYGGVPWREFGRGWGQNSLGVLTEGIFSAQAAKHGLTTPEGSLFTAIPELHKQPVTNTQTATGMPFRLTNPVTGTVNWLNVGLVGVGLMVAVKVIKG